MESSLDWIRPGVPVVVKEVRGGETLQSRLQDFGMVPGTLVCCRYRSPGGFVTAVECRGTVVALRTRDLQNIRVQYE